MSEERGQYLPAIRDEAIMPATFDGMLRQAEVLFKSGLLPAEIKSPAAALAIILAGRELNIPPMQALRSIYVVKGKPALSAQLMGALIWRAGHSYHVDELTPELSTITFQRRGQKPYTHTFTIQDAKAAGLTDSPSWQHYKKAMLFSRCMSAGARIQMSDVIAGMYTVEELADPDAVAVDDDGTITVVAREETVRASAERVEETSEQPTEQVAITTPIVTVLAQQLVAADSKSSAKPAATASNGKRPAKTDTKASVLPERPWSAEYIREMLGKVIEKRYAGNTGEPNPKQLGLVVGLLGHDQERHVLLDYMFGIKSSRELKHCHVCALLDWLKPVKDSDSSPYRVDFTTEVERTSIVEQALRDAGQLTLLEELPGEDGQPS